MRAALIFVTRDIKITTAAAKAHKKASSDLCSFSRIIGIQAIKHIAEIFISSILQTEKAFYGGKQVGNSAHYHK